ncbi:MAG: hypothetical protein JSS72_02545 [Armatimonadetes bacterium]|nr:hypothetical protein [Armatimonadota bacterium]
MARLRAVIFLFLSLIGAAAWAENAFLKLSAYPIATVADARSTVTVTAELRDSSGKAVPDGTQVLFETTLGSFRERVVPTRDGIARAVLVAGSEPDTAKITATAISVNATEVISVEMVSSRDLLPSTRTFLELIGAKPLKMAMNTRVMEAQGTPGDAHLRYMGWKIDADTIQVNVPLMEARAHNAKVSNNGQSHVYTDLFFDLRSKKAVGVTTLEVTEITGLRPYLDRWVAFETQKQKVTALSEWDGRKIRESRATYSDDTFKLADISDAPATVVAKRAVLLPGKEIQFQRAQIYAGDSRILALPLYQLSLNRPPSQLFADQIVNINDNHLAINYPYFLSLKPEESSLVRLRMGDSYGRQVGSINAINIDYEMNWSHGDRAEGGLSITGMNRSDTSVSLRQSYALSSKSNLNAQLDFPSLRSAYGSLNYGQQLTGAQLSLNATQSTTFRGSNVSNQTVAAVIEKDPIKLSKKVNIFFGLTANHTHLASDADTSSQDTFGTRMRLQANPWKMDSVTTFNSSASVSKLFGRGALSGLATTANLSMARRVNQELSVQMGYNYLDDGLGTAVTGRHQLTMQGSYYAGRTGFSGLVTKGLDIQRLSATFDFRYRFNSLWRFAYGQTYSQYIGGGYNDYSAILGYQLGPRELGIVWSRATGRLGITLLGSDY